MTEEAVASIEDYDEEGAVPGVAGRDYPTYAAVPTTSFSCSDRLPGFYADPEARCQAFHVCSQMGHQSFLCPNGTIFNYRVNTCDWWNKVQCADLAEETDIVWSSVSEGERTQHQVVTGQRHSYANEAKFNYYPKNVALNFDIYRRDGLSEYGVGHSQASATNPNPVEFSPLEVSIRPRKKYVYVDQSSSSSSEVTTPTSPTYLEAREKSERSRLENLGDFAGFDERDSQDDVVITTEDVPFTLDALVSDNRSYHETKQERPGFNVFQYKPNHKLKGVNGVINNHERETRPQLQKENSQAEFETSTLLLSANYAFKPGKNEKSSNEPLRRRVSNKYSVQDLPNIDNSFEQTANNTLALKVAVNLDESNNRIPDNNGNYQSTTTEQLQLFLNRFTFNESDISSFNMTPKGTAMSRHQYLPTTKAPTNSNANFVFPEKHEITTTKESNSVSTNTKKELTFNDESKSSTYKIKGHYITEAPVEIIPYRRSGIKRYHSALSENKPTLSVLDESLDSSFSATPKSTTVTNEFILEDSSYAPNFKDSANFGSSAEASTLSSTPLLDSALKDKELDLGASRSYLLGQRLSFENSHVVWPFLFPKLILPMIYSSPLDVSTLNTSASQTEVFPSPEAKDMTRNTGNLNNYTSGYMKPGNPLNNIPTLSLNPLQLLLRSYYVQNINEIVEDNTVSSSSTVEVKSTTESFHDNDPISSHSNKKSGEMNNGFERSGNTYMISSTSSVAVAPKSVTETDVKVVKSSVSPLAKKNLETGKEKTVETHSGHEKENTSSRTLSLTNFTEPNVGLNSRELLNINNLESNKPDENSAEILKSISFSLDLEEDRKNYEKAQAAGLFDR